MQMLAFANMADWPLPPMKQGDFRFYVSNHSLSNCNLLLLKIPFRWNLLQNAHAIVTGMGGLATLLHSKEEVHRVYPGLNCGRILATQTHRFLATSNLTPLPLFFADDVVGGLFSALDGQINAVDACQSVVRAAKASKRVKIHETTPAARIVTRSGRAVGVELMNGGWPEGFF